MRGCITGQTRHILVGLDRVGLVGLREALMGAEASGLEERAAIVDAIIASLSQNNYLPKKGEENLRLAVWREYQRHRGRDIRDLFSEIEVIVRGEEGAVRDEFIETLTSVFGDYELKPVITFEPPSEEGLYPQLLLDDDAVVSGRVSRRAFKNAVRKRISDW